MKLKQNQKISKQTISQFLQSEKILFLSILEMVLFNFYFLKFACNENV